MKAFEKSTVDPKLQKTHRPVDPAEPPSFPTKMSKALYEGDLKAELAKAQEESKRYETNPLSFVPGIKGFEKGNIGTVTNNFATVAEVVDKSQVLLSMPTVGSSEKEFVLLAGVDTSGLTDDKEYPVKGVFYAAGSVKVGGRTVPKLVPLTLTSDERARLGIKEQPKDKKK